MRDMINSFDGLMRPTYGLRSQIYKDEPPQISWYPEQDPTRAIKHAIFGRANHEGGMWSIILRDSRGDITTLETIGELKRQDGKLSMWRAAKMLALVAALYAAIRLVVYLAAGG
jgi:hypothetical protein